MKKNYKYILFDTDWVLVHAEPWSIRFTREYWVTADMQIFFRWIFQDCIIGKADLMEVLPPYLSEWWWRWIVEEYLRNWFESEDLPDTNLIGHIQKLRKEWIKCYVATNQEKYRLAYLRNEMKFDEYFDWIFCSAEMWLKKPQKEYFQYILNVLNIPSDEVLYFDDSLENIEIASSLWIHGFHYQNISDFHNQF